MIAPLPPWLDQNPVQNLVSAASVGSSMGARQREMGDQEAQFGQELQFKQAALAQDLGMQQRDQQLRVAALAQQHQQTAAQLQFETQKAHVQDAENKMRLNMEWEQAARQYQAQGQYQQIYKQLVDSGVDPDKAAMQATMQVGPNALGDTGASTASVWRAAAEARKAENPVSPDVQPMTSGGAAIPGFFMGPKGNVIDTRKDELAQARIDEISYDREQRQQQQTDRDKVQNALRIVQAHESAVSKYGSMYKPAPRALAMYQSALKILEDAGYGGGEEQPTEASDKDPLGLFTQ